MAKVVSVETRMEEESDGMVAAPWVKEAQKGDGRRGALVFPGLTGRDGGNGTCADGKLMSVRMDVLCWLVRSEVYMRGGCRGKGQEQQVGPHGCLHARLVQMLSTTCRHA